MPLLEPDWRFQKVADIPIDLIKRLKTRLIFIDVDNTIAPRDSDDFVKSAVDWIESVKKLGVKFAFVSNGMPKRVVRACKILKIKNIYPGMKPLPFSWWIGLLRFGCRSSRAIMIGDQLPTDILGAHLAGIKAILVDPVDIKSDVKWTRFTRKFFGDRRRA